MYCGAWDPTAACKPKPEHGGTDRRALQEWLKPRSSASTSHPSRCAALRCGWETALESALKPSQARRTVRCRAVRRRSCGTCAPFAFEALSKLVGLLYLPFDSVSRLEASAQVYLR